jgi:hypothetical protein
MYRIVITLTTIPSREESIIKTIQSLLENTVKPEIIYVNMRKYIARLNSEFSPDFREKLTKLSDRIKINESEDYGSLTKIIPIIKAERDPETFVITVDDDIIYNENFIYGLLCGFLEFNQKPGASAPGAPGAVVCGYSGIAYPDTSIRYYQNRIGYILNQTHGQPTEILESGFGLIMKKKWLDQFPLVPIETKNIIDEQKYLYMCDDYILSLYFDKIGIVKKVINYEWIGRKVDDWSSICKFIEESSNNNDSLSKKSSSIQNYYNGMHVIKDFLKV